MQPYWLESKEYVKIVTIMDNKIKQLRLENGYSIRSLAEALTESGFKITSMTISRYERGEREPKLATWQKLADFFDVPVGYIQGTTSENPEAETLISDFEIFYQNNIDAAITKINKIKLQLTKGHINKNKDEDLERIINELDEMEQSLKKQSTIIKKEGFEFSLSERNSKFVEDQNKKATDDQ